MSNNEQHTPKWEWRQVGRIKRDNETGENVDKYACLKLVPCETNPQNKYGLDDAIIGILIDHYELNEFKSPTVEQAQLIASAPTLKAQRDKLLKCAKAYLDAVTSLNKAYAVGLHDTGKDETRMQCRLAKSCLEVAIAECEAEKG